MGQNLDVLLHEEGHGEFDFLDTDVIMKHSWSFPVSSHPNLIGPLIRDAIKVQSCFIIYDDVAKAFESIWFKHFEQGL